MENDDLTKLREQIDEAIRQLEDLIEKIRNGDLHG